MFSKLLLSGIGSTALGLAGRFYKTDQGDSTRKYLSCLTIGVGFFTTCISFIDFSNMSQQPEKLALLIAGISAISGGLGAVLTKDTNMFSFFKSDTDLLRNEVAAKMADNEKFKMQIASKRTSNEARASEYHQRRERFKHTETFIDEVKSEATSALLQEQAWQKYPNPSQFMPKLRDLSSEQLQQILQALKLEDKDLQKEWTQLIEHTAAIDRAWDCLLDDQEVSVAESMSKVKQSSENNTLGLH